MMQEQPPIDTGKDILVIDHRNHQARPHHTPRQSPKPSHDPVSRSLFPAS